MRHRKASRILGNAVLPQGGVFLHTREVAAIGDIEGNKQHLDCRKDSKIELKSNSCFSLLPRKADSRKALHLTSNFLCRGFELLITISGIQTAGQTRQDGL